MKKNILLIIVLLVVIMFTGCKNNETTGDIENNNSTSSDNITQEENSQNSDELLDDSNESTDMNDSNESTDDESTDVNDNNEQVTGSELSGVINAIYEIKDSGLKVGDVPVDLNNMDSVKYYTGLTDISKVKDVAVSEAMIGSQTYSLVLVQLNKAEDAETVANEMLNGIDPRKWICVEADDLQVVTQGDLVMLIMVSSEHKDTVTSGEIVDAFKEVRGGELDFELKK